MHTQAYTFSGIPPTPAAVTLVADESVAKLSMFMCT